MQTIKVAWIEGEYDCCCPCQNLKHPWSDGPQSNIPQSTWSIIATYIIAVTLLCVAMATPGSKLFEVRDIIGTTTTC